MCVVENDSDGVPHAGTDPAHAVAEVHPVVAVGPPHRPVMDCERRSIASLKRHDLGAALHARPLFGQDELATGEILPGLRQEDRDLDRKGDIAVKVLVEAIEITRDISEQKRRGTRLASVVASLEKRRVVAGG